MIEIEIDNGGCHLTFNQGKVTGTGHPVLLAGFVELGKSAYLLVGCAPADGDPDYNAAMLIIGRVGGRVVRYDPPFHGENVIY